MEASGLFHSHQYANRNGVGTCGALLDIACAGQRELDGGRELALVQLDFSAVFDWVNHRGLLFKLQDAGIGGPILAVLGDFWVKGQCCFQCASGQCFGPSTIPPLY